MEELIQFTLFDLLFMVVILQLHVKLLHFIAILDLVGQCYALLYFTPQITKNIKSKIDWVKTPIIFKNLFYSVSV